VRLNQEGNTENKGRTITVEHKVRQHSVKGGITENSDCLQEDSHRVE